MPFCYSCDREVAAQTDLSPRQRCVSCEYQRSLANEQENETLRALVEEKGLPDPTSIQRYNTGGYGGMAACDNGTYVRYDEVFFKRT